MRQPTYSERATIKIAEVVEEIGDVTVEQVLRTAKLCHIPVHTVSNPHGRETIESARVTPEVAAQLIAIYVNTRKYPGAPIRPTPERLREEPDADERAQAREDARNGR